MKSIIEYDNKLIRVETTYPIPAVKKIRVIGSVLTFMNNTWVIKQADYAMTRFLVDRLSDLKAVIQDLSAQQ